MATSDPLTLVIIAAVVLAGYLIGSVSTALVTCKAMGLPDPRTRGSGNPGATNVLRVGNKRAAIITLLGDTLKGLIPVLLVRWALPETPWPAAAVGLAAFVGHVFPVYYGFRGGKGVATAFGVLFGFAWPVGLATGVTWLVVAGLSRYSALAALVSFAAAPFYTAWLTGSWISVALVLAMTLVMIWRHRSNIRNLLAGQEVKLGERA